MNNDPEDEFDRKIEEGIAENPQAMENLSAYVDAEIKAGRFEPGDLLRT